MSTQFPTKLRDYRIMRRLGQHSLLPGQHQGSDGAVYEVEIAGKPGISYALKAMFNFYDIRRSSRLNERYASEFRIVNSLLKAFPHPNILILHVMFNDDCTTANLPDFPYEVTQPRTTFVLGDIAAKTLLQDVRERRNSTRTAALFEYRSLMILRDILQGIIHLQQHKIAHCDLKDDNIMLTSDGRVQIIDFGKAKDWRQESMARHGIFTLPDVDGMEYGGAASIMPPEIYHRRVLGHNVLDYSKFDVFSVGCMIYGLLGDENPFGSEELRESPEYITDMLPNVSCVSVLQDVFRQLVRGMLAANPQERLSAVAACELLDDSLDRLVQSAMRLETPATVTAATNLLTQYLWTDQLANRGCFALSQVCLKNADNQVKAALLGGIECLLDVMRKHTDNAGVMEQACGALWTICVNEQNKAQAARLGGIECLLDVMRKYRDSAGVIEQACGALWSICVNEDIKAQAARLGGLACLFDVMRKHTNSAGVIGQACGTLWSICVNGDNKVQAARLGGIECVLDVMRKHADNAGVMEIACRALGNICGNADNKVQAARLGGIECVLDVIRKHADNAAVVEKACGALQNVCVNDDNKVQAARLGGIELVLDVMRKHADNAGVMKTACGALQNICLNADNKVQAVRLGGIECVLAVMRKHTDNADVVQPACSALKNICINADNIAQAARLGGIECVLDVMRKHIDSAGVMEKACGALRNICVNEYNKVQAARLGGIECALDVMRKHPSMDVARRLRDRLKRATNL